MIPFAFPHCSHQQVLSTAHPKYPKIYSPTPSLLPYSNSPLSLTLELVSLLLLVFYLFVCFREGEGGIPLCRSIYLRIHWLILACALTGDQTCNLGVLGHSNQLNYPARATLASLTHFHTSMIFSKCKLNFVNLCAPKLIY